MTHRTLLLAITVTLTVPTASRELRAASAPKALPVPKVSRVATISRIAAAGDNLKPFVIARPRGGVYLAWARREADRSAVYFARSTDGSRFTAPVRVSSAEMHLDLGAESGPHVAVDDQSNIYVVWAAGSKPVPRPDASAGHGSGHSHPSRPGNLTVYLVRSSDDGKTFSAPLQVNDGPDGPERRFPTVAVDSKGAVCVAWLDKRKETEARPDFARVYFARSTDGGRTFSRNLDVTGSQENGICHCCKLALAAHPTEGIFITFRNACNDLRDMFLVQSRDGGQSFSEPAPIEGTRWFLSACPMNGPSLALDESGNLHAVWCTGAAIKQKPLVGDPEASSFRVLYRRFDARERTWGAPICLAAGTHPRVAVSPDGVPTVTWNGEGIMLARFPADGSSAPRTIRLSKLEEYGAYPSLTRTADGALVVSWQQPVGDGPPQIHVARVAQKGW